MVLYSASFGEQAVESFGRSDTRRNSLFTEVLRSEMQRPGQTLQALADRVALVVRHFADSGGRQQDPESYANLGAADDFALVDGIGAERFPVSTDQCEGSQADWEQISQQPDREALERHRRRFANCATAELARRALVNLVSSSQDPAPAPIASNNQLDDCDRLAAADNDPARPPEAPGVPLAKIDFDAARTACNLSIKRNPRIVRYLFNLGRVEQAAANSMRLDDPARAETTRRAYLALDDAAKRGYVAALYYLAIQLNYGAPSEADNDRANKLLKQAAEQGFPLAAYALGLRYAGRIVRPGARRRARLRMAGARRRKRIGSGDGRSRPGFVERERRLAAQSAPRRRMAAARRRSRLERRQIRSRRPLFLGLPDARRERRAAADLRSRRRDPVAVVVRAGRGSRRSRPRNMNLPI